jgi:hypothetical protein
MEYQQLHLVYVTDGIWVNASVVSGEVGEDSNI